MKSSTRISHVLRIIIVLASLIPLAPWVSLQVTQYPSNIAAFYVRIIVLICLPLIAYEIKGRPDFRLSLRNPLTLSLLLVLVSCIVSSLAGDYPFRSFFGTALRMDGVVTLTINILIYLIILTLIRLGIKETARILTLIISICGSWLGIYSIFASTQTDLSTPILWPIGIIGGWSIISIPEPFDNRVSGPVGNADFMAEVLLLSFFISLYRFFASSELRNRIPNSIAMLLSLAGVYFTGTRGAFIGIVVGIVALPLIQVAIRRDKTSIKRLAAATAVLFVLVFGTYQMRSLFPSTSLLGRLSATSISKDLNYRLVSWRPALKGIQEKPFLGHGPESFVSGFPKYFAASDAAVYSTKGILEKADRVHNFPLQILFDFGLLGFLAWLSSIIAYFWILWRQFRSKAISEYSLLSLSGLMIAYQASMFLLFESPATTVIYYVILGIVGGLAETEEVEKVEQSASERSGLWNYGGLALATAFSFVALWFVVYSPLIVAIRFWQATNWMENDPVQSWSLSKSALHHSFQSDPFFTTQNLVTNMEKVLADKYRSKLPKEVLEEITRTTQQETRKLIASRGAGSDDYELAFGTYSMSRISTNEGFPPETETWFKNMAVISPGWTLWRYWEAIYYESIGQKDRAMKVAEEQVAAFSTDSRSLWFLASRYRMAGKMQEAVRYGLLSLDNRRIVTDAPEIMWIVEYCFKEGRFAEAARVIEMAIKVEPGSAKLMIDAAQVHAKNGETARALQYLSRAVAIDPGVKPQADMVRNAISPR